MNLISKDSIIQNGTPTDILRFSQFENFKQKSEQYLGWFRESNAAFWDILFCIQSANEIDGNLLEIGVYDCGSAIMQVLHQQENQQSILVDINKHETVDLLIDQFSDLDIQFIKGKSEEAILRQIDCNKESSFRWIHIDDGHNYHHVIQDLHIADKLIADNGIVALDDAFHAGFPQVTQAIFNYLADYPSQFNAFSVGDNKMYLCRPESYMFYFKALGEAFEPCFDILYGQKLRNIKQQLNTCAITHRYESMVSGLPCIGFSFGRLGS